jgi:hypothetical protein
MLVRRNMKTTDFFSANCFKSLGLLVVQIPPKSAHWLESVNVPRLFDGPAGFWPGRTRNLRLQARITGKLVLRLIKAGPASN